jgi:hypothetical protein
MATTTKKRGKLPDLVVKRLCLEATAAYTHYEGATLPPLFVDQGV